VGSLAERKPLIVIVGSDWFCLFSLVCYRLVLNTFSRFFLCLLFTTKRGPNVFYHGK